VDNLAGGSQTDVHASDMSTVELTRMQIVQETPLRIKARPGADLCKQRMLQIITTSESCRKLGRKCCATGPGPKLGPHTSWGSKAHSAQGATASVRKTSQDKQKIDARKFTKMCHPCTKSVQQRGETHTHPGGAKAHKAQGGAVASMRLGGLQPNSGPVGMLTVELGNPQSITDAISEAASKCLAIRAAVDTERCSHARAQTRHLLPMPSQYCAESPCVRCES
jgi:hypothetical protein